MAIPSTCPECKDRSIDITTVPPSEHDYHGWQTKIDCRSCGAEVFEAELEE